MSTALKALTPLVLIVAAFLAVWANGEDRRPAPSPGASATPIVRAPRHLSPARRMVETVPDDAVRLPALPLELKTGNAAVRGSVVDVAGGLVAGASVIARTAVSPAALVGRTVTDPTGHFELMVAPGEIEIEVSADGYASGQAPVSAPSEDVRIGLVAASTLTGRVVQRRTREPVAGVTVTARNVDGLRAKPVTAETDNEGEFEIDGLPTGAYVISAAAARFRSEEQSIVLDVAAPSAPVELTVLPATELSALVQAGGKPCASGYVDLDGPSYTTRSLPDGGDGRVHLEGVLPGAYRVTISCVGAAQNPWETELTVGTEPVTHNWDLLAAERGNDDGRDAAVASIEAALVAPVSEAAAASALALGLTGTPIRGTRAGNRITFERLALGRYQVYLEQAPNVGRVVELVKDGQVVQIALEVPAVSEVSGRLVDQQGFPVPDAWVYASTPTAVADARLLPALTGAEGEFVIRGRLYGQYVLRVETAIGQAQRALVSAGSRDVLLRLPERASK